MTVKSKTEILNETEVACLAKKIFSILPPGAAKMTKDRGVDPETIVRMLAISAKFEEARGAKGLSIKEVAKELKTAQYRIRAVETGSVREIEPSVLRKYSALVGLDGWCREWATQNERLAEKLGIIRWD